MHLDVWAATTGVEAGRNPSGGPHQTSPEQSARLIVRAMRRSERERAFGTGDVDEAAQALAHERRRTGLSREQRRHEFEEARAAGIGTGAVAGAAQVVGRLALVMMYVCLFGALGGILVVVGLDAITGTDLMDAAMRSVPGLPQQLPSMWSSTRSCAPRSTMPPRRCVGTRCGAATSPGPAAVRARSRGGRQRCRPPSSAGRP